MNSRHPLLYSIILYVITCSVAKGIQAQAYKPFVEQNKYWDVYRDTGKGNFCRGTIDRFFFLPDTVINGVTYNQLAYHRYLYAPDSPPFCEPLGGFGTDSIRKQMFFREDTIRQEVFYLIPEIHDEEILLFEFNKTVGETVPLAYCNYDFFMNISIIGIDVVPNLYGTTRRKFSCVNDYNHYFDLVEGIGYINSHPFYSHCPLAVAGSIKCVFYGDGPTSTDCEPFLTSSDNITPSHIGIYPNPVTNAFSFNRVDQETYIKIYNSFEQLINAYLIIADHDIDFSDYSSGIYVIHLINKKGQRIKTEKILKM